MGACDAAAPATAPSEPPRPADAAPLRYPANESQDAATFVSPASVFAKLSTSETTEPLHLQSCTLERWFQTTAAQSGRIFIIDPRRMVYQIQTTFAHYAGRGGEWAPDFHIFVVDAATGDAITTITGGHHIGTGLPRGETPRSSRVTKE